MSSTPLLDALIANLYHAGKDNLPASIGGGIYTPAECLELRATLLEQLALLTHFTNNAQAAPRLPNMSGRKPRELECMSCDAKIAGATKARRIGWIVSKYGRRCTCPDCDRKAARER